MFATGHPRRSAVLRWTGGLAAAVLLAGCASGPGADVLERGRASWYGERFQGRRTASGERFDMHAFTAAHKTLPFGTVVRVRSVANGREVTVRVNDRGPHVAGRIIDLSHAAAKALGMVEAGQMDVELRARPAAGR